MMCHRAEIHSELEALFHRRTFSINLLGNSGTKLAFQQETFCPLLSFSLFNSFCMQMTVSQVKAETAKGLGLLIFFLSLVLWILSSLDLWPENCEIRKLLFTFHAHLL